VFIADARRNGSYLRTTWHADGRMFVVSIWNEEVCLGAVRVPVEDAVEVVSLLMDGLVEVVASGPAATLGPASGTGGRRRSAWDDFRAQLRAWARHGATKAAAIKHLRITTEPPRQEQPASRRSA
jgi:hypothetical protein